MLKSGQLLAQLARQGAPVQSTGLLDWTDSSGGIDEDTTDAVAGAPLSPARTAELDGRQNEGLAGRRRDGVREGREGRKEGGRGGRRERREGGSEGGRRCS